MFSWITGPRITNVIEDLQTDPAYDTTFIEPPETPAHQFAVKAFRHALFGTPAAAEANKPDKTHERNVKLDATNSKALEFTAPKEGLAPVSPSKRPGGILATPGTSNKGRKTVSFGSQVIDNEVKKDIVGKSGIPNDCPGKFPSPWTPGTELKVDANKDRKPHNKLTAALLDARTTPQPRSVQKLKAKDDSDITLDVTAPRSESGKYWKEQYESYADKSEKEMKKIIAKQQLAKNFAKKKDGEMTEVSTKLAEERKRFRQRERELEQQNKDFQERLRQAMADNTAASVEITALKNRIAVLDKGTPSAEVHQASKIPFSIFEDPSKDSTLFGVDREKASNSTSHNVRDSPSCVLGKSAESTRARRVDKENSSPKPRRTRRQTLPDASPRPTTLYFEVSEALPEVTEAFAMPYPSQAASTRPSQPFARSTLTARTPELPSKSPLSFRKPDCENLPPKSPAAIPASPLPQGSPDPWINVNDSPLAQMDRLAFPISSGTSSSRPGNTFQTKHTHDRVSKSVSHIKPDVSVVPSSHSKNPVLRKPNLEIRRANDKGKDSAPLIETKVGVFPKAERSFVPESLFKDTKVDVARTTSNRIKSSSLVSKEKASLSGDRKEQDKETSTVVRKAQAKRRLVEKRQIRSGV